VLRQSPAALAKPGKVGGSSDEMELDEDGRPSIFTAPRQLGLKLESTSVPLDVLVVDHIERANPN
jgi:uncharacterized protein (TIGR03435 family)